ncbi:MAG: hypothetical protein AB1489_38760 [Acidobacteriota bacterium]
MEQFVSYIFIFIIIVLGFSLASKFFTRHRRSWQNCAQKYRLTFSQGQEQQGEQSQRMYRLKGYYRTCLITIASSQSITRPETIITVSYPKNLVDNLTAYPEGILGRISRTLARQVALPRTATRTPLMISVPAKGVTTEVQKELSPVIREEVTQLMMICSGKGMRLEMTDAYFMYKQPGFTSNPEPLFPMVDEMVRVINVVEDNIGQLLV